MPECEATSGSETKPCRDRRAMLFAAFFAVPLFAAGGMLSVGRNRQSRATGKGETLVNIADGEDQFMAIAYEDVGKVQQVLLRVPITDRHRLRVENIPVYVCKTEESPTDLRVLSGICPHAGCAVEFNSKQKQFVCPCHKATFDATGKRIEGPSPRDLDPLDARVGDNRIDVLFKRYRLNIAERLEA